MGREIVFAKSVEIYLNELMLLLFDNGYFGFSDAAKQYVDKLISYAEQNIGVIQGKNAPHYFNKFGNKLKYITYKANSTTTWYIFYQKRNSIYLVRHISNSHISGKYFNV